MLVLLCSSICSYSLSSKATKKVIYEPRTGIEPNSHPGWRLAFCTVFCVGKCGVFGGVGLLSPHLTTHHLTTLRVTILQPSKSINQPRETLGCRNKKSPTLPTTMVLMRSICTSETWSTTSSTQRTTNLTSRRLTPSEFS